MSDTDQPITGLSETNDESTEVDESTTNLSDDTEESEDQGSLGHLIPRPATSLDFPPKGDIGKFSVMLLSDIASAPVLEDVEHVNKFAGSEARTPLMTVILAIIAKNGGTMLLDDLANQVGEFWNRSFPTSPFTRLEFIYVLVRSSDSLRVREA